MSDHPTALGGTCSARFDSLRELFAAKLQSGEADSFRSINRLNQKS
jgi:hypothetical protein